jgi:tetratricopeptide (TPR) repeat protein
MFDKTQLSRRQISLALSLMLAHSLSGCTTLLNSNDAVRAIVKAAQNADDKGDFEGAQARLSKLNRLPESLAGSQEEKRKILVDIIKLYAGLARRHQQNGDFETAKKMLQRAIEIECIDKDWLHDGGPATDDYNRLMGVQSKEKHSQVEKKVGTLQKVSEEIARLVDEAIALEREKQFEKAIEKIKEAEKLAPPNSTDKAIVLVSMANALSLVNRQKDSVLMFKEAIQIYEQKPPYPGKMFEALTGLAICLETLNRDEEARTIYVRAVAFRDRHPNDIMNHVFVIGRAVRNLVKLGKYSEAEVLEARFMQSAKPALIDWPSIFWHYQDVGDAYLNAREFKRAKLSFQRALKVVLLNGCPPSFKANAGFCHLRVGSCEVGLGELAEATATGAAALPFFNSGEKLGVAGIYNTIAGAYVAKGEPQKAVVLNEKALKLCEASVGRLGLPTLSTIIQYSDSSHAAGDLAKSKWLLKEAMLRSKSIADCDEKRNYVKGAQMRIKAFGFQ